MGWFNAFKTDHQNFNTKWIGEIDRKKGFFKLFRVTGKNSTSDLSVNGIYTTRINKPVLVIRYNIHFTAILGLFGILVTTFTLFSVVTKNMQIDSWVLWVILFSVGVAYSISIVRDLNKTDRAMEELFQKKINWD